MTVPAFFQNLDGVLDPCRAPVFRNPDRKPSYCIAVLREDRDRVDQRGTLLVLDLSQRPYRSLLTGDIGLHRCQDCLARGIRRLTTSPRNVHVFG